MTSCSTASGSPVAGGLSDSIEFISVIEINLSICPHITVNYQEEQSKHID